MTVLKQYDPIWEPLAFELALNFEPPEKVAEKYGLSRDELVALLQYEAFQQKIAEHHRYIQEKGVTFQMRARLAAELLIDTVFHLARDPDVPPQTRLAAAQTLERWGKLTEDKDDAKPDQTFILQINLPAGSSQETIEVEATPVPQIELE